MTRILGADRVPGRASRSRPRRASPTCATAGVPRRPRRAGRRGAGARSRSAPASSSATPTDPLLVSVRSGARESMPGHARHRPEPRPQRRLGRRAWPTTTEQRALRLGLLPALRADVRQRRARHRGRALRGRDQARQGASAASRTTPSSTSRPCSELTRSVQGALRVPAPTRASSSSRRSGPCSTPGTASAPSTYRRINRIPDDWGTAVNVQQMVFGNKGDDVGLGRRLQPRRGHRRAASPVGDFLINAQGEDVVSGRAQHARHRRSRRSGCPRSTTQLMEILRDARAPLRRHAGHRVHGRGGPAVHAADAQRQAPGAGGRALRGRRGRRGAARQGRRRC